MGCSTSTVRSNSNLIVSVQGGMVLYPVLIGHHELEVVSQVSRVGAKVSSRCSSIGNSWKQMSSSSVVSGEQLPQHLTGRRSTGTKSETLVALDLSAATAVRPRLQEIQALIFKGLLNAFSNDDSTSLAQSMLPSYCPRAILLKFQYPLENCQEGTPEFAVKFLDAMTYTLEKFKPAFLTCGVEVEQIDHVCGVLRWLSNAQLMDCEGEVLIVGGRNISGNLELMTSLFRSQDWETFGHEVGNLAWRLSMNPWLRGERRGMDGSLVVG